MVATFQQNAGKTAPLVGANQEGFEPRMDTIKTRQTRLDRNKLLQPMTGEKPVMKRFLLSLARIVAAGLAVILLPINTHADSIYVANLDANAIVKFASNGVSSIFAIPSLINAYGIVSDSAGNVYVANNGLNTIEKFTPGGVASVFAADPGDGSVLNYTDALAFDSAGNLYAANAGNNTIEKFTTNAVASTFASDPGDGSVLDGPAALAFDKAGNLYAANETGSVGSDFIEKFAINGTPTTFASDPGDGSVLNTPDGLAFDSAGNLFAANGNQNGTIEKFTSNGTPSVFVSSGLDFAGNLAFDSAGNLYVLNETEEAYSSSVIEYDANANSSVFTSGLYLPFALAFNSAGNLFVTDYDYIQEFTPNGTPSYFAFGSVDLPKGMVFDSAGNLYLANQYDNNVAKFSSNGIFASSFASSVDGPTGLGFDSAGNLYVANYYANSITKVAPNGAASTFATDPGDGSVLSGPEGVAVDSAGNVYVVDSQTAEIEKFNTSGTPSTFASTINGSFGPGLAFDKAGYLYVEVPAPGPAYYKIAKFAANGSSTTFITDPGNGSVLNAPYGMAFDSAGNLYVVNTGNSTIEKFTTNGTASLFANNNLNFATYIGIQPGLSVASPTLFITQLGAKVVLSWPVAAGNFGLQSTVSLGSPSWSAVTNIPATVGTNYVVTNAAAGSAKFYELKSN
jgi:DNA-binding beta-propeller fold protein YncE